jgi:hypothetical protein
MHWRNCSHNAGSLIIRVFGYFFLLGTIFWFLKRYHLQYRAGPDYKLSQKGRIMAKLKNKTTVVTKASKDIGAANAKALAFWGACWVIGLAVPSPCGDR